MLQEFKIEEPKNAGRKIVWLLLALAAAIVVTVLIFYFTKINQAASSNSLPTSVIVVKGSSVRRIANILEEQNIINSPWAFIIYVKTSNASAKIQAGDYVLDPKMSIIEIVDILTAGKVAPSEKKVTIIEGWSNRQIGKYLESRDIFKSEEFLDAAKNYEGYLFPDTYLLSKTAQAPELVNKMKKNFDNKTKDLKITKDVVILASIIEKEVGRSGKDLGPDDITAMQEERRLVASVFYNRLKINMALQSDATVNYITGKSDRQVTLEDAKIKSPYNTYINPGLPPGPIGNPGLDSIVAVITPENSDYLYFLNAPDGTAYFAKTIEEHNRNRVKYLQ